MIVKGVDKAAFGENNQKGLTDGRENVGMDSSVCKRSEIERSHCQQMKITGM